MNLYEYSYLLCYLIFFFFANEKLGGIHLKKYFTKKLKGLGTNITKGIHLFWGGGGYKLTLKYVLKNLKRDVP